GGRVAFVEIAPRRDWYAEHAETVRRNQMTHCERLLCERRYGAADHRIRRQTVVAAEWRVVAERNRLGSRDGLQALIQTRIEIRRTLGARRILRRRHHD